MCVAEWLQGYCNDLLADGVEDLRSKKIIYNSVTNQGYPCGRGAANSVRRRL